MAKLTAGERTATGVCQSRQERSDERLSAGVRNRDVGGPGHVRVVSFCLKLPLDDVHQAPGMAAETAESGEDAQARPHDGSGATVSVAGRIRAVGNLLVALGR
jgi:hypothetical protein